MGKKDKGGGKFELTRRDFLKVAGAGAGAAAVGTGADWAVYPGLAAGYDDDGQTHYTTCPYCSAQCGQQVRVDANGNILDVHGMAISPINNGGLCAKGAGGFQLATNPRRLGVSKTYDPSSTSLERDITADDDPFTVFHEADALAWKRTGNNAWEKITSSTFETEMNDIAAALVAARDSDTGWETHTADGSGQHNSRGVMFFGCSHANNEVNYLYKKFILNFGTNNVEHQARI